MKIVHAMEVGTGGVPTYVGQLAAEQVRRGHEVHVLGVQGCEHIAGTFHEWRFSRRRPVGWWGARQRLLSIIRDEAPDLVHLHSFFAGAIGRFRPVGNVALVYQPHGWAFHAVPRWLSPGVSMIERRSAKLAHSILVNCQAEVDEAEQHRIRHPHFRAVGVPVDIERFRPVDDKCGRARRVLLCIGRLCVQKGQRELAAAWERGPLPGYQLVFLGRGEPGYLCDVAPKSFGSTLTHVQEVGDVRPWLAAARYCLISSHYEGQSVAMAEAMSSGVPVVTTNVSGSEVIGKVGEHCPAGHVVQLGEYDELLGAVRRLDESSNWADLALRAREIAENVFGVAQVTNRVLAEYALTLAGHPAVDGPE